MPLKPTVIPPGDDFPSKPDRSMVRPTVIPSEPVHDPAPAAHRRPTAIPAEMPPAHAVASEPAVHAPPSAHAHPAIHPTVVPGKQHVPVPVTLTDIMGRNPAMRLDLQERTVRYVQTVDPNDATDRTAVLWGFEAQKAHAELVQKNLDFGRDETLTEALRYVSRMTEILGLIDLKKVCGLDGGFHLFRRATKAVDTPEELEDARVELQQLVKLMHDRIEPLLALKEEIDRIAIRIAALGDEMEALAEAGAFIADVFEQHPAKAGLARRFLERSASLTQSLAQIRAGDATRSLQVEQPLKLIDAVQHATLVAMPGWLSSIADLMTMLRGARKPNLTEVDELGNKTSKILEALKV